MRRAIRFLRGGQVVELSDFAPTLTLMEYLREHQRATGTKEGCGEGDCGACTVALGRLRDGELVYEPVNSCILLMGQVDGCELVTVEDLEGPDGLHPVQQALVDLHGSQCGFCTPGFVMSLFTLYHSQPTNLSHEQITEWLAGNLCRCTGYRPIVDAAFQACCQTINDQFAARANQTKEQLSAIEPEQDLWVGTKDSFFSAPIGFQSLLETYAQHPEATLVAGATDVGLWVTKHLLELPKIIHLGAVKGLGACYADEDGLKIGASATYAQAERLLGQIDPDLSSVLSRIGSKQVRASGTIGGNIANGSPIGDTPPLLIALGATIELQSLQGRRTLALEDFFLSYKQQDRRPSEVITGISVPRLEDNQVFRAYKISKRFDQDISAVMAAFRFTIEGGRIQNARLAYGGMAATPKRALRAEQALVGADLLTEDSWQAAIVALADDFVPLSDMRASQAYRSQTARALLEKALLEVAGGSDLDLRVTGHRKTMEGHGHAA